jgi:hypothetical protein
MFNVLGESLEWGLGEPGQGEPALSCSGKKTRQCHIQAELRFYKKGPQRGAGPGDTEGN